MESAKINWALICSNKSSIVRWEKKTKSGIGVRAFVTESFNRTFGDGIKNMSFLHFRMYRVVLLFLILILTVSCTQNQISALPTSTVPVSASTDSPSLKIIPFFTTESDPDQLAVLRSLITEYQNLNPGIEVDITIASPASRGTRLLTSLASGADLGIFEIEPALMSQWADAGYLLPLDDVAANISVEDFMEGSLFRQNETT